MSISSLETGFTSSKSKDQNGDEGSKQWRLCWVPACRGIWGPWGLCLGGVLQTAPCIPCSGFTGRDCARDSGSSIWERLANTDINMELSTCSILKYASLVF